MKPGELLPRQPMSPVALRALRSMESVDRVGVTERDDGGNITGYVLVTGPVVAWYRWRQERQEWELAGTAPVEEVAGG